MVTIYPLLQAAEDSVTASGLALEYAGFLAYLGIFGALGFRWLVLLRTNASRSGADGATGVSLGLAEIGAARIGVIGTLFMLLNLFMSISARAADKGLTFSATVAAGGNRYIIAFGFALVFLAAFAAAIKRVRAGWIVAAIAGVCYALQGITSGKWKPIVNPIHEVSASLWIGTLFVMVVAGLPAILRSDLPSEDRGSLVADMVGTFSPVAIGASLLLVLTGITTAWIHLKFVAALWTTPYGYALDLKLVFVATVIVLGAWNWRRMRPQLGSEQAGRAIHRSATRELFFAGIVLVITGVLVSLPSPRLPHP
ncbi:MAG: CopD family protein [Gemmatimonadaceae bacterium]